MQIFLLHPSFSYLQGSREVDDFIKYLAREATNELQGWDRNGKKKGGKKKKATGEL